MHLLAGQSIQYIAPFLSSVRVAKSGNAAYCHKLFDKTHAIHYSLQKWLPFQQLP